jgi:hypothetical protein
MKVYVVLYDCWNQYSPEVLGVFIDENEAEKVAARAPNYYIRESILVS